LTCTLVREDEATVRPIPFPAFLEVRAPADQPHRLRRTDGSDGNEIAARPFRHSRYDGNDSRSLSTAERLPSVADGAYVACVPGLSYGERMARYVSTTVRVAEEDVRALKRARAAGLSASDLIRKGLRVVASRYYSGRRPPSTLLFESTNSKLGDESELFRDLED
jgi:hypothetical protein